MAIDVQSKIMALAQQLSRAVSSSGNDKQLESTLLGELKTVNWRESLLLEGKLYKLTVGGISAGADVSLVTGGGAGTTIDSDQPEIIIGADSGVLIPVEVQVDAQVDLDATEEVGNIIAFADRTQAPPTSVTGTVGTPVNLLDGGGSFGGRAFHTITADITDPVASEVLDYVTITAREFISNGTATNLTNGLTTKLSMRYKPKMPSLLAGPASLVVCWGGSAAVTAIATVIFAHITDNRYPVS